MIEYTTILPPLSNSDHNVIGVSVIVEERLSEGSTVRIVDYNKADWEGIRVVLGRVEWDEWMTDNATTGEHGDIHHHPGKRLQGHTDKKENEKEEKCMDDQRGQESDQKED